MGDGIVNITLDDSLASLIPRLELRLLLSCEDDHEDDDPVEECTVEREMKMQESWINDLIPQMKNLQSVSVNMHFTRADDERKCQETLLANRSLLTCLQNLKACNVYLNDKAEGLSLPSLPLRPDKILGNGVFERDR